MNSRMLVGSLLLLGACIKPAGATGPTVDISGGGTGVLFAAMTANTTEGATLLIQDSATYVEENHLFVGPRGSTAGGRASFNIEAAPGQTPTIVLNGSGIVTYADAADFQIGSNAGGRIHIDARNADFPGADGGFFWYIGFDDGLTGGGMACQALFENVSIDLVGRQGGFVFGTGVNTDPPLSTSASLTLRNVETRGSNVLLSSLYGPASYQGASVNVIDSYLLDPDAKTYPAPWIHQGTYQLGGPTGSMNFSRSTIFVPEETSGPLELNVIVARRGTVTIDHCNIIALASPLNSNPQPVTYSLAAGSVDEGSLTISNSILRADYTVVQYPGTGTVTIADSNLTGLSGGSGVADGGGGEPVVVNALEEWPVFAAFGSDPADPNFLVLSYAASATHGPSPPIGAKTGLDSGPTPARHWAIYH